MSKWVKWRMTHKSHSIAISSPSLSVTGILMTPASIMMTRIELLGTATTVTDSRVVNNLYTTMINMHSYT